MTQDEFANIEKEVQVARGAAWTYSKRYKFVGNEFGAVVCDVTSGEAANVEGLGTLIANAPTHIRSLCAWVRQLEATIPPNVLEELRNKKEG
jgi:hypothetical protein